LVVNPGPPSRFQILVPTETAKPGDTVQLGRSTQSAISQLAGSTFTVTVNLVDQFFNRVAPGFNSTFKLTSTDPNNRLNTIVASSTTVNGQLTVANAFLVTQATTTGWTITASTATGDPYLASESTPFNVYPSTPSQMVVVLNGQQQKDGVGVIGNPTTRTAGELITVRVIAVDPGFNLTPNVNKTGIRLTSSDGFAQSSWTLTMADGVSVASVTLRTAGIHSFFVTDQSGASPLLAGYASSTFTQVANNPTRLRVLLPDEFAVAGSTSNGRTGTVADQNAGSTMTLTVQLTDAFWNLTPGASQQIQIVPTDPFATVAPSTLTVLGQATVDVVFKRAQLNEVRAEMLFPSPPWGPTVAKDTSSVVNVLAGAPKNLLAIVPGESFDPGSNSGKTGIPLDSLKAGVPFLVTVGIMDQFNNMVVGRAATAGLKIPSGYPFTIVSDTKAIDTSVGYTVPPIQASLVAAATWHQVIAEDFFSSGIQDSPFSSTFTVHHNEPVGIQLLAPGQVNVGGLGVYPAGGKTGTASTRTAGVPFQVTVNLVDLYNNVTTEISSGPSVFVNTGDEFDIDSATAPLSSGSRAVSLALVTKSAGVLISAGVQAQGVDEICTGNLPGTQICSVQTPAAVSPPIKVFASTATKFHVLLAGETLVQGQCDNLVVCKSLTGGQRPGKNGTPAPFTMTVPQTAFQASVYLVDSYYNVATERTLGAQDTNPIATMPEVELILAGDPIATPPAPNALQLGSWIYSVVPIAALSTYTVVAQTTSASAVYFSSSASADFSVYPGPEHHLHFEGVPSSAAAGSGISVVLTAHDQFHNLLSTGPNIYVSTVNLTAEIYLPPQDPEFSPFEFSYGEGDFGVKILPSAFKLKKAGLRWIKAAQKDDALVTTERPGFSTRPLIDIIPGNPGAVNVAPGPTSQIVNVRAGSILSPGVQEITGQLSDAYNNPVVSSSPVEMEIVDVAGVPGIFVYDPGGGWVDVGPSTTVFTDDKGRIGQNGDPDNVNFPLGYKVGSTAGNSARIWIATASAPADLTPYILNQRNLSGTLLTIGGKPSRLVFLSSTPVAPVTDVPAGGGNFIIQRLDDFGNLTDQGQTDVVLSLPASQINVHQNSGFRSGTPFTTSGDFGFMEPNSPFNFVNSLSISDGLTQAGFRFRSKMASYSGVSPASNTFYGGRPGYWTLSLNPSDVSVASVTLQMQMDPQPLLRLGFGNQPNKQLAGKVYDVGGVTLRSYQIQTRDLFDNPVVATAPVTVAISTLSRQGSAVFDGFSFSASSEIAAGIPPLFTTEITSATIPALQYEATFFYLDTHASDDYPGSWVYPGGFSTGPVIGIRDIANVLISSAQYVKVLPDNITRIAVEPLASGGVLLAGTTSVPVLAQVQDRFGNPSPIQSGQEDASSSYVAFEAFSNSLGALQFSSPDPTSFIASTGVLRMQAGEHTTTFYLIDTLVGPTTWEVTVEEIQDRSWNPSVATYTVIPGPPVSMRFSSPIRYLVAGTTIQYSTATGLPTESYIDIELVDQFGNLTSSSWAFHTALFNSQNSPTTFGGFDPNKPIDPGTWDRIGPSDPALAISIPPFTSKARAYIWDTKVGTTTLQVAIVRQDGVSMTGINSGGSVETQDQVITPAPADFITIHHPFSAGSPLKVNVPGAIGRSVGGELLGVVLRDKFGNIARGHPINGQYFEGLVQFATSGSTSTVALDDLTDSTTVPNAYWFKGAADASPGIFTGLQVVDSIVESLKIWATAQNMPTVYGFTSDAGRSYNDTTFTPSTNSDGDVFIAGVVFFPTDMAPEKGPDGLVVPAKLAVGQTRPTIRQGDGNVGDPPVQMMRLTARVLPSSATFLTAELGGLRVQRTGLLDPNHVSELGLWYDEDGDGGFDTAFDVFLGSATLDGVEWAFGDPIFGQTPLNVVDSTRTVIETVAKNFFLTLRMDSTGYADSELPSSLGLRLPGPSFVRLSTNSQVGVASNNFAIQTATSPVERQAAKINVVGESIGSWWRATDDLGNPLPLSSYSYVDQGASMVGYLKLDMWTDDFVGTVGSIVVDHNGDGADSDINSVRLFVESSAEGDPFSGNGSFQPLTDTEITNPLSPVTFQNRRASLQLDIRLTDPFNEAQRTVSASTITYYVVLSYAPGATPEKFHGLQVAGAASVIPLAGNGDVQPFTAIVSTLSRVRATADLALIEAVNAQGCPLPGNNCLPQEFTASVAGSITQADKNAPVMKLSMKTVSGSALWSGLKMDRWFHSSQQGGAVVVRNKASDVSDIKIWADVNDNGLLEPATDQVVSPLSGLIHKFPTAKLAVSINSTAPSPIDVFVDNIAAYIPDDDPFPIVPQRLVFADDQIDESGKEVMLCSDVDFSSNVWKNCLRAQEGTQQITFTTGTVISGPARIPLLGLGGGQTLDTFGGDYFVAFDVNPLATVSDEANLGILIPNTFYFLIQEPKSMSTVGVGMPPPITVDGKTLSVVKNVSPYADKVVVITTNTVDDQDLGPFLQQKSTSAVLAFEMYSDVADTQWRWVLVQATGTSAAVGAHVNDIERVSLWRDANNDGLFQQGTDEMLGSGVYGNSGNPSLVRLDLSTPTSIKTVAAASQPQRFFIAYLISANAVTNDPVTQAPRTLGATLLDTSFPQNNPTVDEPGANSLSLPDRYDTASSLPFGGKLRQLIPSQQTMFMKTTPMFSSSSGTFAAPLLNFSVIAATASGVVEPYWIVTSTAGLPLGGPTTYMTIDEEIISYEGVGQVLGQDALVNVRRGMLDTAPQPHSVGAVVAPQIRQGSLNSAVMKIEAWSSAFQVQWERTTLSFEIPPGMNVNDGDIAKVKLWKSLEPAGAPEFHRTAGEGSDAGLNLVDALLGEGVISNGLVLIDINDPLLIGADYTLVSQSTATFFVSFDIDKASRFSHEQLSPANVIVGRYNPQPLDFQLGPVGAGHLTQVVDSIQSPASPIVPTINTLTLTMSRFSPNSAVQNEQFVPMVKIRAQTDVNTVRWEQLNFDRIGSTTSLDIDVSLLRVWQDGNGDAAFTEADRSTDSLGNFVNMISVGNETFETGAKNIVFKAPVTVSTTPTNYFVTYDFSQFAGVGATHGLSIGSTGYIKVEVPHSVSFSSPSFQTNPQVIMNEVPSAVTLGVNDVIFNTGRSEVGQAQSKVEFLRMNLATDIGTARWLKLRVERGGASNDEGFTAGRNTNVGFINIWSDINQNDILDAPDVNVTEANTFVQQPIVSTQTAPFTMVLGSTTGFPVSGQGRLYAGGAELMSFSGGYGAALIQGTTYPTVTIISRGDRFGDGPTPTLDLALGTAIRKVDLFNQNNDNDVQTVVELAVPQTITPAAGVFFVTYNIGATAVKNDQLAIKILDKSWVGVSAPNDTTGLIYKDVTKSKEKGDSVVAYPFEGAKVFISPLQLILEARNIAPAASIGGQRNVPLEQVTMSVNSDFVRVAQLQLTQLGTGKTGSAVGQGDAESLSVWIDDGNGAFTPNTDKLIGKVKHSTFPGGSALFTNGVALVDLSVDGIPYLTVTTNTVDLFFAVDLSTTDGAGNNTVQHDIGFSLEVFEDIIGPNGNELTATSAETNSAQFPARSAQVRISTAIIVLSSKIPPITIAPNGFPAFAVLDSSGNVVISTATGLPIPDESRWIQGPAFPTEGSGSQVGKTLALKSVKGAMGVAAASFDASQFQPLIDINGDGEPDNIDFLGNGLFNMVSMTGTDIPSMDVNGDSILDLDINMDGTPDIVTDDGQGNPIYFIVNENGQPEPVSDQGLALLAWNPDSTKINISWPVPSSTASITGYQIAVGRHFADVTSIKDWQGFEGSITSAAVKGLALPVTKVTKLTEPMTVSGKSVFVANAGEFFQRGLLIVGSELMGVRRVSNTEFVVDQNANEVTQQQCPQNTGRGCAGSLPKVHFPGELISDQAALVSVRAYTSPPGASPSGWIPSEKGRPLVMYRVDTTAPAPPAAVVPQVPPGKASGGTFVVSWDIGADLQSGVMAYEIQERAGTDPVWRTLGLVPAVKVGGVVNNSYNVGNASVNPWESERRPGKFLTYRVRAYNNAGLRSNWTAESSAVATSVTQEVISAVSNYPNPFDTRKGGPEGRTVITYTLGADADVEIVIYDLLGYVVKTMSFQPGQQGAKLGPNFVEWDGKNGMGRFVAKGGYIARIKVGSSLGTSTSIRKIGVIH
ncbi:MAG: hypothetical protein COR54_20300, partial [Elusimicrobia bacterium CG22_combo_CG10-13_8_21_14_all_63_91]